MKKLFLLLFLPFLVNCQSNAFNDTYTAIPEAKGQYKKLKSGEAPRIIQTFGDAKAEEDLLKEGYIVVGRAYTLGAPRVPRTLVYEMAESKSVPIVLLKSSSGGSRRQMKSRVISRQQTGNFIRTTYLNSFYYVDLFNEEAVFLAKPK